MVSMLLHSYISALIRINYHSLLYDLSSFVLPQFLSAGRLTCESRAVSFDYPWYCLGFCQGFRLLVYIFKAIIAMQ